MGEKLSEEQLELGNQALEARAKAEKLERQFEKSLSEDQARQLKELHILKQFPNTEERIAEIASELGLQI